MPAPAGVWGPHVWGDNVWGQYVWGTGAVSSDRVVASALTRLSPRFTMATVQPEFALENRAPRFPFDRLEVEE